MSKEIKARLRIVTKELKMGEEEEMTKYLPGRSCWGGGGYKVEVAGEGMIKKKRTGKNK